MTEIYLIRHAEAEGNLFRRLQGQFDANITPAGLRQIRCLRERFAKIRIDAVYSSHLCRTRTTAQAIYTPKGLPLRIDRRFCEIGAGVWEDCAYGDLERLDAQSVYDFIHHPRTWHTEGSEPFLQYTGRFLEALDEAAAENDGRTIAVFSHGMALGGLLLRLFFPEKETAGHPENTAVAHLFYENGVYRLDYMNDASHLPPELTTQERKRAVYPTGSGNLHFAPGGEGRRSAFYGDEAAGFSGFSRESAHSAVLTELHLEEKFRGYGMGAQLCGDLVSTLRHIGVTTLRIDGDPGAKRGFFERIGFQSGVLDLTPRILEIG